MSLRGRAYIDLTAAKPGRLKSRLSGLASMPDGASVILYVGALVPEPEAVWVLRDQEPRLVLTIEGECGNVPRWLDAIRTNFGALAV